MPVPEQVHQRASQQQQIRGRGQDVSAVVPEQIRTDRCEREQRG
jgi:hypothetical protein